MPPKKQVFENYTNEEAKAQLEDYNQISKEELSHLQIGSNIKYAVSNVLKGGGILKAVHGDYFVLQNRYKPISWCVQFRHPSLKIWILDESKAKSNDKETEKIMDLFKQGKLIKKPSYFDEMKVIYKAYKQGRLIEKK